MKSVIAQGKSEGLAEAKETAVLAAKEDGSADLMLYINDGKQVLCAEWPDADVWEIDE